MIPTNQNLEKKIELYRRYHELSDKIAFIEKNSISPLKSQRDEIISILAKFYELDVDECSRTKVLDSVIWEAGLAVVK